MNIFDQKHGTVYAKFFKLGEQSIVLCENCLREIASEIHHIKFKSEGGEDTIENLIALCWDCHKKAHTDRKLRDKMKDTHLNYIQFFKKYT